MGDSSSSGDFQWSDSNAVNGNFEDSGQVLDINKEWKKKVSTIITSVSNFSVQYNFQAIAIALSIMSKTVCTSDDGNCENGDQASWVASTSAASVFVGAITGQLGMGYLGDILGRSAALKLTLTMATIGAVSSAALSLGNPETIYAVIVVSRFLLGVGVGGVYPLSATKAAEDAGSKGGGVNSVASAKSFFWQAPGAVFPWVLALLINTSNMSANGKWRFLLGFGAIPSAIVVAGTFYEERLRAEFPPALTVGSPQVARSVGSEVVEVVGFTAASIGTSVGSSERSDKPAGAQISVWDALRNPIYQRRLIVSAGGWFLYDVCYYGMSFF